jgi:dihydrolipoamide dehydrogenase
MDKFDVVVIGAGPGGYPAAIRAAQLGSSVAIVEREALGGTCLNWGCIPTKTLIASSDLFFRMKHSAALGLESGEASFDYAAMADRKNQVVGKLRGGIGQLLKANNVTLIEAQASFESRNRIRAGDESIEASKVIIATGSKSAMPSFLPRHDRVVDSREFLDMTSLPESMIVVGGGVIGCEFACMAAQLGAKVTIVEMLEDIVIMLDADIRRELKRRMTKELGIEILTGVTLEDIEAGDGGVSSKAGDQKVEADLLLASVGRLPVTDGLGLENAGIETDEHGFIEIDPHCLTATAGIYAVGDVTAGTTQLAHAATSQGICAAENACTGERREAETIIPACIFTAPEIGGVGLTEQDAKDQGRDFLVGKFMFAGLGKAMASGETGGFVKWLADPDTCRLLGAHAIGPHATELIAEATMAVRMEMTEEELRSTIHCHPTFSESWMEAAHAVHGECIHQPPRRRK